jgi:glycosyltransferase involved in cell wall biosynthesis
MKINIIFRKFSGLDGSFHLSKWQPVGSPVLINFIKYLDEKDELQILLVDDNKKKNNFLIKKFKFENLRAPIYIINKNFFDKDIFFFKIINNLILLSLLMSKSLFSRFDAHYIDNQNVVSAALLSLIKKNVTLRLLGAWGINFELNNLGFFSKIRKLAYRFNFKNVICSDDGSNFEKIINKKIFSKKSSVYNLLNGSEFNNFRAFFLPNKLRNKKLRILHYGRFDVDKGSHKFIKTVKSIIEESNKIEFLIFGYGKYFDDIKKYIIKHKLQNFVKIFYKQNLLQKSKHISSSDMYISTNLIGSLSNSTLEAMGSGVPSIFVDTKEKKNYTIKKNLKNKYFYFEEKNFEKSLKNLIFKYYKNPYLLKINSISIKSKFSKKLLSWEERVKLERKLLSDKVFID